MDAQTAIPVEIDYTKTKGYDQVLEEYNHFVPLKDYHPVFLCYCNTTQSCFVSKVFKQATIESYPSIKIIQ